MRSTPTCSAKTASNTEASTRRGSRVASGVDAIAAVVIVTAAHATIPPAKIQTRAVPRSRIVARSALYSSWSRAVMVSVVMLPSRGTDNPDMHGGRRFAHCGTGLGLGLDLGLCYMRFWLIRDHNPLAVYRLSATLLVSPLKPLGPGKL